MKSLPTVCTSAISTMIKCSAWQGLNINKLFVAADLDPAVFNYSDSRMTLEQSDRIAEQAFKLTKCENIGLRAGQFMVPGNWNIVGYIMMNCHTLGEAFGKYRAYERIVSEGNKTELRLEDELAILDFELVADTPVTIKQHSENILSCMVTLMKILAGKELPFTEIRFTHEAPGDISEYEHIFHAPLSFGQPSNALLFDKKYIDLPIAQPNRNLLFLFEQHAKELLQQISPRDDITVKVRHLLINKLPSFPDIETVAKELGMSARSLQLKLKAEDTSYQIILDEIRKDVAISHLRNHKISVSDVAYLLGFSEPSAFYRTFKRWTGYTPREYRTLH